MAKRRNLRAGAEATAATSGVGTGGGTEATPGTVAVLEPASSSPARVRDQPFTLAHWSVSLPERDVTAEEASGPLSDLEQRQLAECHRAVDNARSAQWMLGMSLEIVRRRRLHRGDGTRTWVQYLAAEHDGMTERDARRLQEEWRLAKTVQEALGKPAPASHVRAMLPYADSTSDDQAAADYVRLKRAFDSGKMRLVEHQIKARVDKAIETASFETNPQERARAVATQWHDLQAPQPIIPAPAKVPRETQQSALREEATDPLVAAVNAAERALERVNEALLDENATMRRAGVDAEHLQKRLRKVGRILTKTTVSADDVVDAEIVES